MDFRKDIKDYIALEIETLNKLDVDAINDALNLLMEIAKNHKRIYVFGSGGSSATASHIQNDFGMMSMFYFHLCGKNHHLQD